MSDNTKRQRAPKGEPFRFITDVAVPFAGHECLIWPFTRPIGYGTIRQGRVKRGAHRVVCELAHGLPPTPLHHAAHTCGNGKGGCVNPKHLVWKTPSANQLDKNVHGTMARGERNGSAKLLPEQAKRIRNKQITFRQAAVEYGVSKSQFYSIAKGQSWRHLS